MSYLSLAEWLSDDSSKVTKGVISFWFRVPQASLDAAIAEYNAQPPPDLSKPPRQLDGIIPLVTFGEIFDGYLPKLIEVPHGTDTFEIKSMAGGACALTTVSSVTTPAGQNQYTEGDGYKLNQSYIGIDCTGSNPDDPSKTYLTVRLQTHDFPDEMSGYIWVIKDGGHSDPRVQFSSLGDTAAGGGLCGGVLIKPCTEEFSPFFGQPIHLLADSPYNSTQLYTDQSEVFRNAGQEYFGDVSPTIEVTADEWHHILLSFDISGRVSTTGNLNDQGASAASSCKMWCAFDDVNYTGADLPSYSESGMTSLGPNDIITKNADLVWQTTNDQPAAFDYVVAQGQWGHTTYSGLDTAPTYKFSPTGLAVNGSIGLPASEDMVDHIKRVEMAEFQFFTGVTADTGSDNVRRYFIDDKGKPVPPNQKSNPETGQTSGSIEGLGRQPDILLHGSGNWIKGKNTGMTQVENPSTGVTDSLPADDFDPTGKIRPYKPDPSLDPPAAP